MRLPRRLLAAALCAPLLPGGPLARPLGAQPADTGTVSTAPLFTEADAWIAAAYTVSAIAAWPLDKAVARRMQDSTLQAIRIAKRTSKVFRWIGAPGSLYIGTTMYAAGRLAGRGPNARRIADLGLHGTEAVFLASTLTGGIKALAGRARPYNDVNNPRDFGFGRGWNDEKFRSFPSGHSTMAYAAASAVVAETRYWKKSSTLYVAPIMYGGAGLIALSRMYDNYHWASDVTVGAAIGTFAGLKIVRYHHSHPGNRIDDVLLPGPKTARAASARRAARAEPKWMLTGSLVPGANGGHRIAWGLAPVLR